MAQPSGRSADAVAAKVAAYEEFLDSRLRRELAALEERRQQAKCDLQEYVDLGRNVDTLREVRSSALLPRRARGCPRGISQGAAGG